MKLLKESDGFERIAGVADDIESGVGDEQAPKTLAEEAMVVNEEAGDAHQLLPSFYAEADNYPEFAGLGRRSLCCTWWGR